MELKDVIHFYLGVEIETSVQGQYVHPYGCVKLTELTPENLSLILYALNKKEKDIAGGFSDSDHIYCKLKLRPLSSMTEEEKTEIAKQWTWFQDMQIFSEKHFDIRHEITKNMVYDTLITADESDDDRVGPTAYFQIVPYLCKQGFDLFNLIPTNQAIDSTKL